MMEMELSGRVLGGDAMSCLNLLESMADENPGMFVRYLADEEGRLVNLFWSDTCSQLDYEIFGDVLAFDATYRNNKYMCRLVVFSGVNHHNQTIVFAAALVSNEKEETYVWLVILCCKVHSFLWRILLLVYSQERYFTCLCTYTPTSEIYTISKSESSSKEWRVSHYPDDSVFKCSCFKMEFLGVPCDHIVAVLNHLEFSELPRSLVLDRWTKDARSKFMGFM